MTSAFLTDTNKMHPMISISVTASAACVRTPASASRSESRAANAQPVDSIGA